MSFDLRINSFKIIFPIAEVHEFLAEPLAEGPNFCMSDEIDVSVSVKRILDPSTYFGSSDKRVTELSVRYLGPTVTLTELLQVAKGYMAHLGSMPSYRTWVRMYHAHWKRYVRFRHESQHSLCTECCRFKEYQRSTVSRADAELVANAYMRHLKGVMDDRRLDQQWRELGKNSVTFGDGATLNEGNSTWLTMTIDGMDCAKFKIPRNVPATKEFSVSLLQPILNHHP